MRLFEKQEMPVQSRTVPPFHGQVTQLVEWRVEIPLVPGSIPGLSTSFPVAKGAEASSTEDIEAWLIINLC